MSDTRIETDSLGDVEVPATAYYGAQTERARRNFPVSGIRFSRRFIAALGMIKGEAAAVNAEQGNLDESLAPKAFRFSFLAEQRTKRESTYSSKPVNSLGLLN